MKTTTNVTPILGDGYSWNALPPAVQSDGDAILVASHIEKLKEHDFMYYVELITGNLLLFSMCIIAVICLIAMIRYVNFKLIVKSIVGLFIVIEEPKYEPELYRAISKATNGAYTLKVECKDNCVHCGGNNWVRTQTRINWVRTQTRIKCQYCGIIK